MRYHYTPLILLVVTLCIAACQPRPEYRIGVSQCSADDWRNKMNEEIYREIMFHPEAMVEIRSADDNNEKQIADIRYFMDNDFDIIIAAPNEADPLTPIITEAYESGIPVVLFDRNINGDAFTAWQGADNVAIGEAAAKYARSLIGEGGRVIEIYGRPGATPAIERHNGFVNSLPDLGLELVASAYGYWNHEQASHAIDSLLDIHQDIDLVFAHNDRMAIAVSEAARRRGLDLKVIGIDAAPEIGLKAVVDSVIDVTFLYPTEGYRLIRTALAILRNEPYEHIERLPLASAVDYTNADILLMQNDELIEETNKIRLLKTQIDDYWSRHSAQTSLFYSVLVILLLLFGVFFLLLKAYWQRRRYQAELLEQNHLLEQQRDTQKELNEQLNVATQSKLMFFTNVSHDLRTPLTLIAEPVEQLAQADNLTPRQMTLMRIANKNVRILRRLINQILDFRKYENGRLDLHLSEVALRGQLLEWADAFNAIARKRDIRLGVNVDIPDDFTVAVDVEKIERVVFNLLSNAFKYTPDNGSITLTCRLDGDSLMISVADNGQGIPAEDIANIFDRFYQVDKVHPNGSGIGLSLAKAFIELHGGSIGVESTLGTGTVFTITLPVRHVENKAEETTAQPVITPQDVETELGDVTAGSAGYDASRPLLLVIDDNYDLRCMISELLGDEYNIITAANGKEGLSKAARYVPDLIICDVMMPVMDGLECCRRIKEEISTSHIPVLMLTACSMDEQRAQGYEVGADGYVAKPFSNDVLKSRCRNLIDNRKRIRELWKGSQTNAASAPAPQTQRIPAQNDIDSEFYARFMDLVRSNMSDADLSVDSLAGMMGLGRSQFYRKIKALTNYSPVELLRNIRLKQARELLTTTEKSVSEIAYEVGFSTPAYFTRCYREVYGETPTDLRDRLGRKS